MNFRQFSWSTKKKTNEFLTSNEFKQKGKSIKGSLLSILAGLMVAAIIVMVQNVNPFEYFYQLFKVAFNGLYVEQTMNWFAVYMIAGIGIAVGFKSGVFNIGMAGQMLAASSISTIVFWSVVGTNTAATPIMVFVTFIICLVVASFLAAIAGALKAYFNIHEVVSTIMLNWIVWYLFKFVFSIFKQYADDSVPSTSKMMPTDIFTINGSNILIPLLISGGCILIVAILFAKTTFGFKLKAVGSSQSASKYAGINVKTKIIQAMTISGAFAGVAAFINMYTISPNTSFTVDNLPTIGYEAIAVSLVAFNNPFGIIFVGGLWGVIQSAGPLTSGLFGMPTQISGLIFGVIIYFAAISIIFMNFAPTLWVRMKYYTMKSKTRKITLNGYNAQQAKYRHWIAFPKKSPEYAKTIEAMKHEEIKLYSQDFKETCRMEIHRIENQINLFKKGVLEKEITSGLRGLKYRKHTEMNKINSNSLEGYTDIKLDYLSFKDSLIERAKNYVAFEKTQIRNVKKIRNQQITAAKVWKQGAIGELSLEYAYINGKVQIKGDQAKELGQIKDKIVSLRTDLKLQIDLIKLNDSLSETDKSNQIIEVKSHSEVQIKNLKASRQEVKNKAMEQIAHLKREHLDKVAVLKEEQTQIIAIEKEFEQKIVQANAQFERQTKALHKSVLEHQAKYDLAKSEQDLKAAIDLLEELKLKTENKLIDIKSSEVSEISELSKIEESFDDLINLAEQQYLELVKIFGEKVFASYDNNQYVMKKVKIALEIQKIKMKVAIEKIMKVDKILISINNDINNNILKEAKLNLLDYKSDYKSRLAELKQAMSLTSKADIIKLEKEKAAKLTENKGNNESKADIIRIKKTYRNKIKEIKQKQNAGQETFDRYLKLEKDYNQKVENYIKTISAKFMPNIKEVQ
ncbi:ABC transporter permease [Mesoplasma syrphidae]|uniref:ABC transporter permease n=1 Tax=Mesoplasma syrphidae TaxID=225999 RepID=A0A2K9BS44_9MOLU|nr:ABC transporter permease [Mesoplasma syrphidae]AUF83822.1 ABC transporter permease [Mesoplasma syrphidae]